MPRKSNFTRLGNWATRKKNNMGNAFVELKADVKHKIYKTDLGHNFAKPMRNANNRTLKARTYKLAGQARNKLAGYGATAWGATKKHMYNRPKNYIKGRMSSYTRKRDLAKREEKILLDKYKVTKAMFTNDRPALTIKLNTTLENMSYNEFMNDVKSRVGQDFIDAYEIRNKYAYNFFSPNGLQIKPGANIYVFTYTPSIWAQIDAINTFYKSWKARTVPTRTESLVTHPGSISGRASVSRRRSSSRTSGSNNTRRASSRTGVPAVVPKEEPLYYTDNAGTERRTVFDQTIVVHYTPETNPIPYYIKIDINSLKTSINSIVEEYPNNKDIKTKCANILQFLDTDINTETKVDNLYPSKCTGPTRNRCNNNAGIFLSNLETLKWDVLNQRQASKY